MTQHRTRQVRRQLATTRYANRRRDRSQLLARRVLTQTRDTACSVVHILSRTQRRVRSIQKLEGVLCKCIRQRDCDAMGVATVRCANEGGEVAWDC